MAIWDSLSDMQYPKESTFLNFNSAHVDRGSKTDAIHNTFY